MKFRSEQAFTDAVIDLFKLYGWRVYHNRGDMRRRVQGHSGFPDLVLARRGVVLFRELKMPRGHFQPGQQTWLAALDGKTWWPADWDEIVKTAIGPAAAM